MTRADEYRKALEFVSSAPYLYRAACHMAGGGCDYNPTIRRALRIAEMLEEGPSDRMLMQGEKADSRAVNYTGVFKAMAAELIKQAEEGEKQ